MKNVLIVEDEKMIRQGIKTMVQRSGVPVEVILECNNGETALEVIKEQKIDVMFTDIRMPKMDGIELVKQMQKCEHIPLTVAISGYDDFSYAVEMMRQGVREYILKPIERQKIIDILVKLNQEIEQGKEKDKTIRKIGIQQIKYLLQSDEIEDKELETLKVQYGDTFYQGEYVICCTPCVVGTENERNPYIYLEGMPQGDIYIVEMEQLSFLLCNELKNGHIGISAPHRGLEELHIAYIEAIQMRRKAFCRGTEKEVWTDREEKIPEKLREEAKKLLDSSARMQRVQLIGTDRWEELQLNWNKFFAEAERGRILPEEFERCMQEVLDEIAQIYRNLMEEREDQWKKLRMYLEYPDLKAYQETLLDFMKEMQQTINNRLDSNQNKQKIQQAITYVEENFAKDLNMAVVSNYISMNYSLFSYSFKQYTGSNFVNYLKDIRMREAKRLLSETDQKIIEISQAVGYENEKHFMKIFKAACGVSPSEFRKNMQL